MRVELVKHDNVICEAEKKRGYQQRSSVNFNPATNLNL